MTANIELLLITGAGASTAFGADNRQLPMMAQFNDSILTVLANKPGFREATGLEPNVDGHQFERRLGAFLQAWRAFPQIRPLLKATAIFPDVQIDLGRLHHWHEIANSQLEQVVQDIYRVTYAQFSPDRVAVTSADAAYRRLLEVAGVRRLQHRLVVATTNYDTVADTALEHNRWHPLNGSGQPGAEVDVTGLLEAGLYNVPVLHLHGCLGWYRDADRSGIERVISVNNTQYDPGFGTPAIMLPEPKKDYDSDPFIRTIWEQFREAVRAARRVLIIGHSLNDDALIEDIRANIDPQWVGVTTAPDAPDANAVRETIGDKLPGAHDIRMMFTNPLTDDAVRALTQWLSDTNMAPPRDQAPPAESSVL